MSLSQSEPARHWVGPILVGALINAVMNGMLLYQISAYIGRFWRDSLVPRSLVLFCGMISIASAFLGVTYAYILAILDFGDVHKIATPIPIFHLLMLLPRIQSASLQMYFSSRGAARSIGHGSFFRAVIISVVLQVGCSVVSFTLNLSGVRLATKTCADPVWIAANTLACITEIAISTILVYDLRKPRSGRPQKGDLFSHTARLTVETGLVATCWILVATSLFAAMKDITYQIFVIPLPALYANTLLSALNSRTYINGRESGREQGDSRGPVIVIGSPGQSKSETSLPPTSSTSVPRDLYAEYACFATTVTSQTNSRDLSILAPI